MAESRRERSLEVRDDDDSPVRTRWVGGSGGMEIDGVDKARESSKHRKDRSKSSGRREDKDYRSRDRERSKTSHGSKDRELEVKDLEKDRVSSRDRRKEDKDEQEKEKSRDKVREKDTDRDKYRDRERDKDRKDRGKEKDRERERERDAERGRDKERGKDKSRDKEKDREKERDMAKDRERENEREKHRDRENERDRSRNVGEKEKVKERTREKEKEKEKEMDQDKERPRDKDRGSHKLRDEGQEKSKDLRKDDRSKIDNEDDQDVTKQGRGSNDSEDESEALKHEQNADGGAARPQSSGLELDERILKMKEERLKKKSEGASEVLAWVYRSRKLEERRNVEKEKALQLSRVFEEQDNMNQGESDDEDARQSIAHDLSGVKVLHGIDKVLEGGAVVLTLKDQSILADGGLNEEVDVLENVEIGEQKRRDEAYKAAKKKPGTYEDKFSDDPGSEKKILPQYDDPVTDEGITLDTGGHFTGEAEKKLEELRRRIQGVPTNKNVEHLNASGKILSDYYTQDEMLQFKKPKKKKSLRKKEKLDIHALEAEAISAGLGVGDLGSRNDGKRQAHKEERERNEAEIRTSAYQSALAKADEASKILRLQKARAIQAEDEASLVDDDDEELRKSLERARRVSLKKQDESVKSGPHAIALFASSTTKDLAADNQNPGSVESQEKSIVFTEMEGFFLGLQHDEEGQKPESKDVFMEEDEVPNVSDQETKEEDGGWSEVKEIEEDEKPEEKEEDVVPDETIHEAAVGKGLSGALKLLKERGALNESIEWGGRNMDKKKSKLVGIYDDEGQKEIRIERTDEYGRTLTPKEAFRLLSHKFHGKGPGKMKQEKRMRQYEEEMKVKQMKNADTPSLSVERMREAQAQLKTPYLVLSGHVKPGQTSDPRSGFATVEKDQTPMLGDEKVEFFLGNKRKLEPGNMAYHKKPKT